MTEPLTSKNLPFGVGDIITAYRKGYHKVTDIVPRYIKQEYPWLTLEGPGEEGSPLIVYQTIANDSGKRIKSTVTHNCDAHYCMKASEKIKLERKRLEETIQRLVELEKELS